MTCFFTSSGLTFWLNRFLQVFSFSWEGRKRRKGGNEKWKKDNNSPSFSPLDFLSSPSAKVKTDSVSDPVSFWYRFGSADPSRNPVLKMLYHYFHIFFIKNKKHHTSTKFFYGAHYLFVLTKKELWYSWYFDIILCDFPMIFADFLLPGSETLHKCRFIQYSI